MNSTIIGVGGLIMRGRKRPDQVKPEHREGLLEILPEPQRTECEEAWRAEGWKPRIVHQRKRYVPVGERLNNNQNTKINES